MRLSPRVSQVSGHHFAAINNSVITRSRPKMASPAGDPPWPDPPARRAGMAVVQHDPIGMRTNWFWCGEMEPGLACRRNRPGVPPERHCRKTKAACGSVLEDLRSPVAASCVARIGKDDTKPPARRSGYRYPANWLAYFPRHRPLRNIAPAGQRQRALAPLTGAGEQPAVRRSWCRSPCKWSCLTVQFTRSGSPADGRIHVPTARKLVSGFHRPLAAAAFGLLRRGSRQAWSLAGV